MSDPRPPATPESGEGRTRALWPHALLLFALFYLAEPQAWDFSTGIAAMMENNEEVIVDRVQENIQRNEQGNIQRRVSMPLLGAYGIWCLVRGADRRLRIQGLLGWTVLGFLFWTLASLCWSIDPTMTVRRLFVFALQCVGALGFAMQFRLGELIRLTAMVTGIMMGFGFLSELALGSFRPWGDEYRYAGLTYPAFTCWTLSLLVLAMFSTAWNRKPWLRLSLAAFAAALALLTKTRAGAAAMVLGVMSRFWATWSFAHKAVMAWAAALVASLALLIAVGWGQDVDRWVIRAINLGREETAKGFSGRAGVWTMLTPYLLARPLQGFGFESFWTPEHLREIGERNWGAPDAHNGYINLTLGVGAVGTGLFALSLALTVLRSRSDFKRSHDIESLWPGNVVVICAVNTLCIAVQMSPYIMSFLSMVAIARLAFVEEPLTIAPPPNHTPGETSRASFGASLRASESPLGQGA